MRRGQRCVDMPSKLHGTQGCGLWVRDLEDHGYDLCWNGSTLQKES